ncbi:hypothetical protein K491DRAFT_694663 [Lophiostoma macrostomum CBS 122681]|uniref:Uncharacterized protein n=1 Tax=Lophiostoma macrostomum CBS 122681 TaxID=1314788 RepID=A0A6A6T165_9PLEO|nr:hypothetical protein K491DRAFT_694663 [Lophiostoma macrostomum CBS 122681]
MSTMLSVETGAMFLAQHLCSTKIQSQRPSIPSLEQHSRLVPSATSSSRLSPLFPSSLLLPTTMKSTCLALTILSLLFTPTPTIAAPSWFFSLSNPIPDSDNNRAHHQPPSPNSDRTNAPSPPWPTHGSYHARSLSTTTSPPHIDTINSTSGIPTAHQVATTRLTTFCTLSPYTRSLCAKLSTTVSLCIDTSREVECDENHARALLAALVEEDPCEAADQGSLTGRVCANWWRKANECQQRTENEKGVRGPCAIHHVYYLLSEWRGFLGLRGGEGGSAVM